MNISKDLIQEIKSRNDIVEIVSEKVTSLKRTGGSWTGLCPFHQDKKPSFSVSPAHGIYKCFACGESGDLIKFVEKTEGLEFIDAVKYLAKRVGIVIEDSKFKGDENSDYNRREKLAVFNSRIVKYFKHYLTERPEGKIPYSYLLDRGLTRETIDKFNLGFSPPDRGKFFDFLTKKGFTKEFLLTTGLFSNNYEKVRAMFFNRIIFPIFDHRSECVGFGGRALEPEQMPKYLNTPETVLYKKSRILYGIDLAKKSIIDNKRVFLVEGYMDVIAMNQNGVTNTVAPCGTAVTKEQISILAKYADEIVVLLDNDAAGVKGGIKAVRESVNTAVKISVMRLEGAKDPDEFFLKHGIDEFNRLVEKRVEGFEFMLNEKGTGIDVTDVRLLSETINFFFDFIRNWENEIIQNGLVMKLADRLNVDKRSLAGDFLRYKKKASYSSTYSSSYEVPVKSTVGDRDFIQDSNKDINKDLNKDEIIPKQTYNFDKQFKREAELIIILSRLSSTKDVVLRASLRDECFVNDVNRELYNYVISEKYLPENKNFMDYIADNTVRDYYASGIFSGELDIEDENLLLNICVDRIADLKKKHLERQSKEISSKIKLGIFYKDNELVKRMQEEKSIVIGEILKLNKLQELKNSWKTY